VITLHNRVKKEGETKWLKMALIKAEAKLKRYGITTAMVAAVNDKRAA